MTNVFIPDNFFKDIKVKIRPVGKWVLGEWVKKESQEKIIKAVYMPVSLNEIKNYPQGLITLEDIDLRTKENLNLGDIIKINNKNFIVIRKADYDYIADLKFYILRRSDKDD